MDTPTQQTAIITAWVVMTVLAAVTVGMRFYTRRLILHILGPEDWLIFISMVRGISSLAGADSLLIFLLRCCQLEPASVSSAVSAPFVRTSTGTSNLIHKQKRSSVSADMFGRSLQR